VNCVFGVRLGRGILVGRKNFRAYRSNHVTGELSNLVISATVGGKSG